MESAVHVDASTYFFCDLTHSTRYAMVVCVQVNKRCQSRRYIPKIMVGCAITRPQWKDGKWVKGGVVGIVRSCREMERKVSRYAYDYDDSGKKIKVGTR